MARQKKSEIDAILEQLKNSYFDDSQDIEEESPAESYMSEEDAELAAVLEKIFTTSEDIYMTDDDEDIEESSEAEPEAQDVEIFTATENAEPAAAEAVNDAIEAAETPEAPEIIAQPDGIKSEKDMVDDVLKSMFHVDSFEQTSEPTAIEETKEEPAEPVEITEPEIVASAEPDITTEVIDEPASKETPALEENIDNNDAPIVEEFVKKEIVEEESSSFELIPEEVNSNPAFSDLDLGDLNNVYLDEICEATEAVPEKKKITSPDEYVDDIMQYSLSGISFFKPQRDVDFSIIEASSAKDSKPEDTEAQVVTETTEQKSEITDKEIALLMKLGYSGEINASGENDHAHKVIFDESKDYVPEKHEIIHGFTGKEFSSRAQIPAIQKKFKADRIVILIQAILMSVLALTAVITDLIAAFSYVKHTSLVSLSLLCTLAALVVMSPRVYSGLSAIFKFDTNQYSLPSLILAESLACNLIIALILALGTASMTGGVYYSIGGYAILYMAFTAWAEWIDCYRESGVFNFVASNNIMYVAEKRTSADVLHNENKRKHSAAAEISNSRYIIKQARFISGFHKKTTNGKTGMSKIFLSIGIIPSIAIIVGMIITIVNDSLVSGLSGMTFILYLSAPLLGVVSLALIEFLSYLKLRRANSVLVGYDAVESISNIQSLVFRDKDAIEVVACTPINPNKNADNPKKWLNIAGRVFETLGGPLSTVVGTERSSASNIEHDVAINSISDNGIDIYFDSSMNILIGDRAYMQAHNIKVKTDVNLTGAIRGADRTVIYMAFDKVPQLGFIITSNIKRSFLKIITLLSSNNINVEVKSYEPEINEYFFELNLPDCPISTVKPLNYESTEASDVSDCELVSSNPLDICRSVVYSKVVASDVRKIQKQRKLQSAIGFIASLALAALVCLPSKIKIVGMLQAYAPVLFYAVALAMIIPNVIHIIKVLKRK